MNLGGAILQHLSEFKMCTAVDTTVTCLGIYLINILIPIGKDTYKRKFIASFTAYNCKKFTTSSIFRGVANFTLAQEKADESRCGKFTVIYFYKVILENNI